MGGVLADLRGDAPAFQRPGLHVRVDGWRPPPVLGVLDLAEEGARGRRAAGCVDLSFPFWRVFLSGRAPGAHTRSEVHAARSAAGVSSKALEMFFLMLVFRLSSTLVNEGYLPVRAGRSRVKKRRGGRVASTW